MHLCRGKSGTRQRGGQEAASLEREGWQNAETGAGSCIFREGNLAEGRDWGRKLHLWMVATTWGGRSWSGEVAHTRSWTTSSDDRVRASAALLSVHSMVPAAGQQQRGGQHAARVTCRPYAHKTACPAAGLLSRQPCRGCADLPALHHAWRCSGASCQPVCCGQAANLLPQK